MVSESHADSPEDPPNEQQEPVVLAAAGGSLENGADYEGCPSNLHGPVTQHEESITRHDLYSTHACCLEHAWLHN